MFSTTIDLEVDLIDRFDPISDDDLAAFESSHQVTLPQIYRAFLKRFNGGKFKDSICLQTVDVLPPDSIRNVHEFFAINPGLQDFTDLAYHGWLGPWQREFLAVAWGGGGWDGYVLLGIAGSNVGAVYYWYPRIPEGDAKVYLVARDLDAFLANLQKQSPELSRYPEPEFAAAEAGDLDAVRKFVDRGGNVNARSNTDDATLLTVSARQPHVIKFLLERGVDPNVADKRGQTAVFAAAVRSFDSLKLVMAAGGNPDVVTVNGTTAIISSNDLRSFQLLIERGANINLRTTRGSVIECRRGDPYYLRKQYNLLLAAGYDLNYDLARLRKQVIWFRALNPGEVLQHEGRRVDLCESLVALGTNAAQLEDELQEWLNQASGGERGIVQQAYSAVRGEYSPSARRR